jgi:hypothetical protein
LCTSTLWVALAAAFASHAPTLSPAWHSDYREARDLGEREHKPLVVVIGSSNTPWANLSKVAEQDESINRTLLSSYVCLFVDVDTANGDRLAKFFEMKQGLVISDKSGEMQAYRQAGELPANQVARALTDHAKGEVAKPVFQTTSFGAACST